MSAGPSPTGERRRAPSDRVVVTAPGKLILMGEHAAVYGRPAVVAAIDLRTEVEAVASGRRVELELPDLGHRETTGWAEIDAYAAAYAERWRRFDRDPSHRAFADLVDEDPARVVKLALGEARRAMGAPRRGVRLRVASEIPVGSGFGSSASVAVAVAGALAALAGAVAAGGEGRGLELLSGVALEVERRQHGRPSGVDHATVLRGGILRIERPGGGSGLSIEPLTPSAAAVAALAVFDTGPPAESTGEVVAAVRARIDADRERFAAVLDAMEEETRRFAAAVTDERRLDDCRGAMRRFARRLEDLGVVPAAVRRAGRRIERHGGAAKLSGAGALTGSGAGALLVYRPPHGPGLAELLPGYPCHRAAIGAPGFRIEQAS